MRLKEKIIRNKTFKKVLIVSFILFVFTLSYGFVLLKYDLTLMNTYDYTYNLNPCTSENEYTWASRKINCLVYYEKIIVNKIFGNT